jgi:hypothetical protein
MERIGIGGEELEGKIFASRGAWEEVVSLYRAVAKAELDDIAQVGFRQHPNSLSLESKLFATSPEDAARFGRDNFRFDEVPFHSRFAQIWRYIPDCAKLWA